MDATRVKRRFRATPERTADATWTAILEVTVPPGEPGRDELEAVRGVACTLIAAEAWRSSPAVLSGVGPQLRIYCLHGEEAITGEDAHEDSLQWSPTDGDWRLQVPCPPEDSEWVKAALAAKSDRVTVADGPVEKLSALTQDAAAVKIDPGGFLRR